MTTRAANSQTKNVDLDRLRADVETWRVNEGASLRHFCKHICKPPVDPSNTSRFLRGVRDDISAATVATYAKAIGREPADYYNDAAA